MPSSPRLPPNMRRHSSYGRPATAFPMSRWTATTWSPPRPSWRTSSVPHATGRGPSVVEAATYRWHGHYEGDPERYRSPDELEEWRRVIRCCINEARLRERGVGDDQIKALEASSSACLDGAVEAARRLAKPVAATLTDFVVRPRPVRAEPAPPGADAPVFRTMDAIRSALEIELAEDDRVFLAGVDVGAGGNVFGLTRGLAEAFVGRVRDTPISETADHRPRCRCGHGGDASRRRVDVPRLHRGLLRPAPQSGGEAALHDRWRVRRWRSLCGPSSVPGVPRAASIRRAWRRCWPTYRD